MNNYQGKKITVVGLARSGAAAARLLRRLGACVRVTDQGGTPKLQEAAAALAAEGVEVELGRHSRAFLETSDALVISPGVALDAEPCLWAREKGIDVVSEVEIAAAVCPAPIIAITGTNGKTTTTTLVGDVIMKWGRRAHVVGNIGVPFSSVALDARAEDFVVLEISSFQLEAIRNFRPKVAAILNVSPDHMDRYRSFDDYLDAKKRVFLNQGAEDCLILNFGDTHLKAIAQEARSRVVFFNRDSDAGPFNQNQLAVLAVAEVLGIPRPLVLEVFKDFRGVEHRMEKVRELDGIEFINDSKATNIDSTIWALQDIKRPAILIAGGRDKGSDFRSVSDLARRKVKFAVLIGEAHDRIASAWQGLLPCEKAADMEAAVALARAKAAPGDIVLLSPMCKSFDMFTDYEHRGRVFKDIVARLR